MVKDITMEELKKIMAELAKAQKETERVLQETRLDMQETRRDLKAMMKNLSDNVGGVNRRIGKVVEMVVLPGLMKKMNELGHKFTVASAGKKFTKNSGEFAELDLMLENCREVMAVEAKARFRMSDLNKFLKTIKRLRKNETITGVAGKTIYAGIAGVTLDAGVHEAAVNNGMYIIRMDDDYDNEKITVIPPPEGKAGTW